MSTIQTSSSLNKRKKGLSLSLQKRKINSKNSESTTSVFKNKPMRQSLESINTSANKNRIKFAQSYEKHQTGSKFKRQNYLKITDQDIKLGGTKRTDRCERKILSFTKTTPFSQQNSRIEYQPSSHATIPFTPFTAQRKVLRQSKVVNLTSNINYFQLMNSQNQNSFYLAHPSKPYPPSALRLNLTQPLRQLQILEEQKLEDSEVRQSPFKKLDSDKKQDIIKQSMDKFTLQKLKKVQIDIDQLLAKASQTRAMLLR